MRDYVEVRVDAAAKLEDTRWTAHADIHRLIAEALAQSGKREDAWRANSELVTSRVAALEHAHNRETGRSEERQRESERRAFMTGLGLTALTIVVNVLIMLAWHR